MVHYWATALVEQGHRVVVVSQTDGAAQIATNYEVVEQPAYLRLCRLIRSSRWLLMFDVSLKALPAWLFSGTPLYISHQSGLWYPDARIPFRQQLKRWVANRLASGQIACSQFLANHYRSCGVVYNPIRHDIFFNTTDTPRTEVILFAGRLVSDKGADILLQAFALLVQHQRAASLMLHIAGDGPMLQQLRQQAQSLGIASRVVWLGMLQQDDLAAVMRSAKIMVVPSRLEPMGMVAAEGLACGLRMVLSRQGGLPEVGGSFCLYFTPGSPEELCNALLASLEQPAFFEQPGLDEHLQKFSLAYSIQSLQQVLKLPKVPFSSGSH